MAEGCDYKCSFCIIPTLRGHYRSRPVEAIVREARSLAARGVRELILISQDTTFYGRDLGEGAALPTLLRELNAIDGIDWIRLLYLYPTTITDDILDAMAECDKVCKYIDLPLQHAADDVLRRMKRPGTGKNYDEAARRESATAFPASHSERRSSSVFPARRTPSSRNCATSCERRLRPRRRVHLLARGRHDRPRAAQTTCRRRSKTKRRNALMAEQKRIVARAQKRRVGAQVQVMVDGPSPEHELVWRGRLAGQAPDIDPVVYLTDADLDALRPGRAFTGRNRRVPRVRFGGAPAAGRFVAVLVINF